MKRFRKRSTVRKDKFPCFSVTRHYDVCDILRLLNTAPKRRFVSSGVWNYRLFSWPMKQGIASISQHHKHMFKKTQSWFIWQTCVNPLSKRVFANIKRGVCVISQTMWKFCIPRKTNEKSFNLMCCCCCILSKCAVVIYIKL